MTNSHHLGHLVMECMLKRPDAIFHIDAATGAQETNASVLRRSIQMAKCLLRYGAKPGDVLGLADVSHLDLYIPYYAASFIGMPILGIEPLFKYHKVSNLFSIVKPKIAFVSEAFRQETKVLDLDIKFVTFRSTGEFSYAKFIEEYDDKDDTTIFKPLEFDTDKIYAWLVRTSGTSGGIKLAAIKHQKIMAKILEQIQSNKYKECPDNKPGLLLARVQWISAYYHVIRMPLANLCMVQSSGLLSASEVIDMINKYKPVSTVLGPSKLRTILRHNKHCDFTCFEEMKISGEIVDERLMLELKVRLRPDAYLGQIYAQTENIGRVLDTNWSSPTNSCGTPLPSYQVKLIDLKTEEEITKPNIRGELWTKGYCFTEYYNDPEKTAAAFSEDGFYKTGDYMYRDEHNNYYFVERKSFIIKFREHLVIPAEIDVVIRSHPAVLDVHVTNVPNAEDGEHAVACVVKQPGVNLTEKEIVDFVASKLPSIQHLHGGVIFMDQLPLTTTGKIARAKLRQFATTTVYHNNKVVNGGECLVNGNVK